MILLTETEYLSIFINLTISSISFYICVLYSFYIVIQTQDILEAFLLTEKYRNKFAEKLFNSYQSSSESFWKWYEVKAITNSVTRRRISTRSLRFQISRIIYSRIMIISFVNKYQRSIFLFRHSVSYAILRIDSSYRSYRPLRFAT